MQLIYQSYNDEELVKLKVLFRNLFEIVWSVKNSVFCFSFESVSIFKVSNIPLNDYISTDTGYTSIIINYNAIWLCCYCEFLEWITYSLLQRTLIFIHDHDRCADTQ